MLEIHKFARRSVNEQKDKKQADGFCNVIFGTAAKGHNLTFLNALIISFSMIVSVMIYANVNQIFHSNTLKIKPKSLKIRQFYILTDIKENACTL